MLDLSLPIRQISPLLPHSGKMVLLDKITNFGTDFLEAETTLDKHCLLAKKGIIDSLMGAEIMAQGVAAWAGRSEERRVGKECRSRWSPYH